MTSKLDEPSPPGRGGATPDGRKPAVPGDPPLDEFLPTFPISPELPPKSAFERQGVPYLKLIRWGWIIVSFALGWFIANLALSILVRVVSQYNVQVLATVVSGLTVMGGAEQGSAPLADSGGFLKGLLPVELETAALVFAVVGISIVVLQLLDRVLTAWTDNIMLGHLQQRLHDQLLTLGPAYHQRHDLGETTLIVTRFSSGAQLLLRDLIAAPLVRGISLTTAVVFLANNLAVVGDTPLSIRLFLLAVVIVMPVLGWWLATRLRGVFERVRDSETALMNEFTNSASLPLEVQLLGAERQRSQAFAKRVSVHIKNKVSAALRNEVANQFQTATPLLLQTALLIYGVFFALRSGNPAAAGAILAIYYFVPQIVEPVQEIIQFVIGLNTTWPQVEKVVEILEAAPEAVEEDGEDAPPTSGQTLQLSHVTFSYEAGGVPILDDVSHEFPPGQVTAIVSRSGGGKSTLLNLIARLYDPRQGTIRLGGRDLRNFNRASLRRHIFKVSQFPLFITDTVRANLQLAWANATDAEIEAICRLTGLWEMLVSAAGPDTHPCDYVLPRASGEGLSGGQRRLLAVTRALMLQPTVLLLDEPTTGIDAIGRQLLADVLHKACAKVTVLLVDHDMQFVSQVAQQVCCLEQGRFTDVGTPAELASRMSLFRQLLEGGAAVAHHEAADVPQ